MATESTDNRARLLEACMAILQGTPDQKLGITLLNKALFYADLIALRELGHPITGAKYIALDQGPVVASYTRRIVRDLEKAGWAKQVVGNEFGKPVAVTAPLSDFPHLSPEELSIAREIAAHLHDRAAWAVSNFSHENPGWRLAYKGAGQRAGEINMLLALQQVAEDDPWLDEPADESVHSALLASADDPGEPF